MSEKLIFDQSMEMRKQGKLPPNWDLPGLDPNGRYCQEVLGGYLVAPEEANKRNLKPEEVRAFVSWERKGPPVWKSAELMVFEEMGEPTYVKGETFKQAQERKVEVIKAWEKKKDEEQKAA